MKIIDLQVGFIGTNCYIVYDDESKLAVVIDPGGSDQEILAIIKRENLSVKYIINTHGHVDHITANLRIKDATAAPILIHEADAEMLIDPRSNMSAMMGGIGASCGPADYVLKDGDAIEFGNIKLNVIHTPGHTPGGICLLSGNILFSGDTLFEMSVGRSDFPGGSHKELITSIKDKLMLLADDTKVLPGHGAATTIGDERKMNPFIQ
ncbi:MAG: putative metallo-hydrolase [Firmicutes bacterium]|nr:putative metallo-hydrolase [Bacillota bacterium]